MFFAYGWVKVRSSHAPYAHLVERAGPDQDRLWLEVDDVDEAVHRADEALFDRLEEFLSGFGPPDLDWHFRRAMNNDRGTLLFASSRNHRTDEPTAVRVLHWLAEHGPGSHGLVYVLDHEDDGSRTRTDHSLEFRVWRLLPGRVEELPDPFFSPLVPVVFPNNYAVS